MLIPILSKFEILSVEFIHWDGFQFSASKIDTGNILINTDGACGCALTTDANSSLT